MRKFRATLEVLQDFGQYEEKRRGWEGVLPYYSWSISIYWTTVQKKNCLSFVDKKLHCLFPSQASSSLS